MKTLRLTNDEYRQKQGVSNSDLMLIERSPSDFAWAQNAPRDALKTAAFDFGTALHTAMLEPEKFNDQVVVYTQTKTRETKAFQEFMQDQGDGAIILLESEYNKLRFAVDGARHHPAVNRLLTIKSDKEGSIFVKDEERGIIKKIRPDLDYVEYVSPILADLK
jgi:exodeoxyribonuclease VIII